MRRLGKGALALLLLPLAGCGASSAPPPVRTGAAVTQAGAPATASPRADYASAVLPTIHSTLQQAAALLGNMQRQPLDALAQLCTEAGGGFADQAQAYSSAAAPPAARRLMGRATAAYTLLQGAAVECANASDGASPVQMATATRDLQRAVSTLSSADTTLTQWSAAAH